MPRMKCVTIALAVILTSMGATSGAARATEVGTTRTVGLGVQILDPTALIGKVFLDRNDAIDFGIGFWGYGTCYDGNGNPSRCNNRRHDFSLHFDYLYEEPIVDSAVRLDWHAGVGGRMVLWGYTYDNSDHGTVLLARVPLGLDLAFRRPRWLEGYLEIAPALVVVPFLDFAFDVGLGVRAYF